MRDNWKELQLGEIGVFKSSGVDKIIYPGERIVRLVNYMDVYRFPKLYNSNDFSETSVKTSQYDSFSLVKGDVLFTPSSETPEDIGHSSVIMEDLENAVYSYHVVRFRVDKHFLNDGFKAYVFNQPFVLKQFEKKAAGSTRYTLTRGSFEKTLVRFPPLPQQQKIAKILSIVDTVIEQTVTAIAKYQAIKQGLMHDLFTRGIDVNTGKLRPTPQDASDLYKESALGLIPKEWEVEELGNLTKLVTDGAHFSPVPQEKGFPIGNVKDMRDANFDYDKCTKILPEVFKLLVRQNCSPIKGDVLLSKDGTIGKVIHFEDDREIVLLSSIAIIRVNELLYSKYLAWALKSEYFDKALYALLSGSALKRITLKDIAKINLPFSKNIEEQKEIAIRLQKIQNKIQTEQQALAKYQQIKAGLMQDLLTGRVEVSVEEEVKTINS